MAQSYTLNQALKYWRKSKESQTVSSSFEKYLFIALRKYIIPKLYPELGVMTPKDFKAYIDKIMVKNLDNAIAIFEESSNSAVANQELSKRTQQNYYSVVKRFINWMKEQLWWQELTSSPQNYKICPPQVKVEKKPKSKNASKKLSPYGLTVEELPVTVQEELEDFKEFRLKGKQYIRSKLRSQGKRRTRNYPQVNSVKEKTIEYDQTVITRFLGWYIQQNFNQELSLKLLTNVDLIEQYAQWSIQVRKAKHTTAINVINTAIAIAKWLNFDKIEERDWSDIPLILELQDLHSEYKEIYKKEKQSSQAKEWNDKEISHKQAREVVQYLGQYCAPQVSCYVKDKKQYQARNRRLSAIVRSWQKYLIIKILVYCPVRQEEIRNLKLNETLFRQFDEQGFPYYIVNLKEHKRSSYKRERIYRLPSILTEDLNIWIDYWLPLIMNSIQTVEKWIAFWGDDLQQINKRKERLQQEKSISIKNNEKIKKKEKRLQKIDEYIENLPQVQETLNSHNYLFFKLSDYRSFGQPHDITSIYQLVTNEMIKATKALYGEPKLIRPHDFRNIAEKQIRLLGKSDITNTFATWIGHSEEMGDEYAAKITTDDELTEEIVDNWWKPRDNNSVEDHYA